MIKKLSIILLVLLGALFGGGFLYLRQINNFQVDGEIPIKSITDRITIKRDANGIPYIFAQNIPDLIRGQGFAVGQDRIFQVELYRKMIKGQLSELIGETGLTSDIQLLVLGLQRNAARHAQLLDQESKDFLTWYAEGYNAFLTTGKKDFPVELSLLGITPAPMTIEDLMAVQHYIGFSHGQNYADEVLGLNLASALGPETASKLSPLNINPDRKNAVLKLQSRETDSLPTISYVPPSQEMLPVNVPNFGSNNWTVNGLRSTSKKPLIVNDPHLDSRILPGAWFPIGLFCPEVSAVGSAIPGLPGILTGRNKQMAFGVTNAYGDSQDLYLESEDPREKDHYLDHGQRIPYQIIESEIRIKDDAAPDGFRKQPIKIRSTKRGPIISDHAVFNLNTDHPVSLRWVLAELEGQTIGVNHLLTANTVQEMDSLIGKIDIIYLNFVFADVNGSIGHRASGLVPIRAGGAGAVARQPSKKDDWIGFIPKNEMPGQIDPVKGWLGTANHDTRPDSFPYYYSAHFSPYYRYERIDDFLSEKVPKSPEDHWQFMLDVTNAHARRLNATLTKALKEDERTVDLGNYLEQWDYRDETHSVAASIFHLTHEYLLRLILQDQLSSELLNQFFQLRYYWLQRMDEVILNGDEAWINDIRTPEKETLDQLIVQAGQMARERLAELFGEDPKNWTWGQLHTLNFISPLRTSGIGREWLGYRKLAVAGSGETINRGQYVLDEGPYEAQWFSSMRMVVDLADHEKIRAVISGGNAARQFHPYFKSQIAPWARGEWLPWWFDPVKINEHKVHELVLIPEQ